MRLETLEQFQRECAFGDMQVFAQRCRHRYLLAAKLLEVNSVAVQHVEELFSSGAINTWLLLPAYAVVCERYNRAFFSPQENLFYSPNEEQDAKWNQYFWLRLVPDLIERDDVVRNVLRAVNAIPSVDPAAASHSLEQCVREMNLPPVKRAQLWVLREDIDLLRAAA